MNREYTAFAPASVSNVACGFDIMGFALDAPGDTVTARFTETPGVRIGNVTGAVLPTDPLKNTAAAPVASLLRHAGSRRGIEIDIQKGIPVGGGIGSSAASAVAAAMAANALLETGLSLRELLPFAIEGEIIASGAVHVDNLAPSLFGGFILVRGYDPLDVVPIEFPGNLWCVVLHPHLEIRTIDSRRVLPTAVPIRDLVRQTGNAAGLVVGLSRGDFALIGRSLVDVVAEPARKHLIPGFDAMKAAALGAGALGCSISGSGPSLFALSASRESASAIGKAMGRVLPPLGQAFTVFVSRVGGPGARVIGKNDHASD
jgi:homoserine kinase